jgi:hypothetical protein
VNAPLVYETLPYEIFEVKDWGKKFDFVVSAFSTKNGPLHPFTNHRCKFGFYWCCKNAKSRCHFVATCRVFPFRFCCPSLPNVFQWQRRMVKENSIGIEELFTLA